MKEVYRDVFSTYSKNDTFDIFMNKDYKQRLIVSDLDGTLHCGRNPRKYRGITLVDFSIALAKKMVFRKPGKIVSYLSGCLETRALEKDIKAMVGYNTLTLSDAEEILLDFFFDVSLKELPYNLVRDAGSKLDRKAYKKSIETMKKINENSLDFVIVTKTLFPCLRPYVSWFKKEGVDVGWACTELEVENGEVKGYRNGLFSRADKRNRLVDLLDLRGRSRWFDVLVQKGLTPLHTEEIVYGTPRPLRGMFEEALVFGDTDEDLGLVEGLEYLGIPTRLVAVNDFNELSKELIREADFRINGWEGLHVFLNQKAY